MLAYHIACAVALPGVQQALCSFFFFFKQKTAYEMSPEVAILGVGGWNDKVCVAIRVPHRPRTISTAADEVTGVGCAVNGAAVHGKSSHCRADHPVMDLLVGNGSQIRTS